MRAVQISVGRSPLIYTAGHRCQEGDNESLNHLPHSSDVVETRLILTCKVNNGEAEPDYHTTERTGPD